VLDIILVQMDWYTTLHEPLGRGHPEG